MSDWRDLLLRRFSFPGYERVGRNPLGWPDYAPVEAVRGGIGEIGGHRVVAAVWDLAAYGGSFGELDATAFAEAADRAARYGEPLVSFVRGGGVRRQEGMAALVGMPRAQLALRRLAAAGVPHLAVADQLAAGELLASVVTRADVRAAVDGEAASAAYDAGLVDALVAPEEAGAWLERALAALARPEAAAPEEPALGAPLDRLLPGGVDLRAEGGDPSVRAVVGQLAGGPPAVGVAVGPGGRPTPAGYRLVQRAATLAGRHGRALVALVDTPGAEAGAVGVAAAVADTLDALLACPAPTVAVVTGESGSGAMAVTVADLVLVTPGSSFAALGPADLLALGFADALAPEPDDERFGAVVAAAAAHLAVADRDARLAARVRRWSAPLPGRLA